MGGCASSEFNKNNIKSNQPKANFNRATSTKSFAPGEIYYIKQSTDRVQGEVVGGRGKAELFFSLAHNGCDREKLGQLTLGISIANQANTLTFLGATEQLEENSLRYHTTFRVDFFFERTQTIKIEVLCMKKKIDCVTTTLGKVMGSKGQLSEYPISVLMENDKVPGIVIKGAAAKEELKKNNVITFTLQYSLVNSYKGDLFVIIKSTVQRVYKSKEGKGKCPIFVAKELNINDVNLGDEDKSIEFQLYESNKGMIGSTSASLNKIIACTSCFDVTGDLNSIGTCNIKFLVEKNTTFLEFIETGLQISLIIGIDYTASNNDPKDPISLHYCGGPEPNHYEQAIRSCGGIVAYYDYDNYFPVLGFGGQLPGSPHTSHCFNCNFKNDPNVYGLEGIISTYRNSLPIVRLSGPTLFYPLIQNMIDMVKDSVQQSSSSIYYILLILTDGQIHDMDDTEAIICQAAKLPISIIIIGIGNEDFSNMVRLDGDTEPLKDKFGNPIERDIVQFVTYNDFKSDSARLAAEVLYEVPGQVEKYYRKYKNFNPIK